VAKCVPGSRHQRVTRNGYSPNKVESSRLPPSRS
jgi:hypothetical protein